MRTFVLAALIVLLSAPVYAQGLNLSGIGEKTRSPAEKQRDREVDQAYKSATEKIPNQNAKVDPWHAVRGTSASHSGQAKP